MDTTVIIARSIFAALLLLIGYALYRGFMGAPRWYWLAGGLLYGMSAVFAMSIGGWTAGAALSVLALALVHTLQPTAAPALRVAVVLGALVIWAFWLWLGDITWLFWPLLAPLDWIFAS